MTLWKLEYIVYKQQIANRLFPSCLLPLCENKPSCEAIIWKCVSPTCSFSCKSNTFSYESFCTKTRFETEAQANSKMAYYMNIISNLLTHVLEIDQCLNSSKLRKHNNFKYYSNHVTGSFHSILSLDVSFKKIFKLTSVIFFNVAQSHK